jgi:hypothetical protein
MSALGKSTAATTALSVIFHIVLQSSRVVRESKNNYRMIIDLEKLLFIGINSRDRVA